MIKNLLAHTPNSWIDAALSLTQWLAHKLAGLLALSDWHRKTPLFFKHVCNLYRWWRNPALWSFTARGVYARELMQPGCQVLDLCCGDGSTPYLFFTDAAARIDAVDSNPTSIRYARKHFVRPNLRFHEQDIVATPFPQEFYDVVVWNAGICYLAPEACKAVLQKIASIPNPNLVLVGTTPRGYNWRDHQMEFASQDELRDFLLPYFREVTIKQIQEGERVSFYFKASAPHGDASGG